MILKKIGYDFTICKLQSCDDINYNSEFYFIGRTDDEISLVCLKEDVPKNVIKRDDGWKAFKINDILDFSLIGILSKISTILSNNKIGIFVISTFNTDYFLVKNENYERALDVLLNAGYIIV